MENGGSLSCRSLLPAANNMNGKLVRSIGLPTFVLYPSRDVGRIGLNSSSIIENVGLGHVSALCGS